MEMIVTEKIRRASINWLLTIQQETGNEVAMKCYDVMREGFGEDLAGAVLFGLMSGDHGGTLFIRWANPNHGLDNKINAIKSVRYLTGVGLGEAKTAVESCVDTDCKLILKEEIPRDEVDAQIRELERAGLIVR